MEQTIKIADKPTLDEVKSLLEDSGYGLEALKNLLGEQDSKQSIYNSKEGYESGSDVKEYKEVVNIEGKGKLYFASCRSAVQQSRRGGIRITKNPNSNSSEVIMEKIINNSGTSSSDCYGSIGFFTKDFLPQRSSSESNPREVLMCSNSARGTTFALLDKNNAVTPSKITKLDTNQILALFSSKPIEFTEGLKLEIFSYGYYGIVYSLDDE